MMPEERKYGETSANEATGHLSIAQETGFHVDVREVQGPGDFDFEVYTYYAANTCKTSSAKNR